MEYFYFVVVAKYRFAYLLYLATENVNLLLQVVPTAARCTIPENGELLYLLLDCGDTDSSGSVILVLWVAFAFHFNGCVALPSERTQPLLMAAIVRSLIGKEVFSITAHWDVAQNRRGQSNSVHKVYHRALRAAPSVWAVLLRAATDR